MCELDFIIAPLSKLVFSREEKCMQRSAFVNSSCRSVQCHGGFQFCCSHFFFLSNKYYSSTDQYYIIAREAADLVLQFKVPRRGYAGTWESRLQPLRLTIKSGSREEQIPPTSVTRARLLTHYPVCLTRTNLGKQCRVAARACVCDE